jgi:predicted DNA-binding protein
MVDITEGELQTIFTEQEDHDRAVSKKRLDSLITETLYPIYSNGKSKRYRANYSKTPLGVRLSPKMQEDIETIAENIGLSRAETMRKGLEVFVKYCNDHPGFVMMVKKDPWAK